MLPLCSALALQLARDAGIQLYVAGARLGGCALVALEPIAKDAVVLTVADSYYRQTAQPTDPHVRTVARQLGCGSTELLAVQVLLGQVSEEVKTWFELMPSGDQIPNYYSLPASAKQSIVGKTHFRPLGERLEAEFECTKYAMERLGSSANVNTTDADIARALTFVSLATQPVGGMDHPDAADGFLLPVALAFTPATEITANVVQDAESPLVFRAARNIAKGETLNFDLLGPTGNLETMLRFGFEVSGNVHVGRSFDLTGEPAQAQCPPVTLRSDGALVSSAFECHRLARVRAFTAQFGSITQAELDKEHLALRHAVAQACHQMRKMITGHGQSPAQGDASTTGRLVRLLDAEMNTLLRCEREFLYKKQTLTEPPVSDRVSPDAAKHTAPFSLFMETFDLVAKRGLVQ